MIGCVYMHTRIHACIYKYPAIIKNKETNSVVLVRERTIPTEQPPLVGEVSANFSLIDGFAWSARRIPTAVFSVF
jgi:hypothetical protein